MILLEKWTILTLLQKLPNNVGDLGKIIVATSFEWLPKLPNLVTLNGRQRVGDLFSLLALYLKCSGHNTDKCFFVGCAISRCLSTTPTSHKQTNVTRRILREPISQRFCLHLPSCGPGYNPQAQHSGRLTQTKYFCNLFLRVTLTKICETRLKSCAIDLRP